MARKKKSAKVKPSINAVGQAFHEEDRNSMTR
jgi:hypothetical protein